MVKRVKHVWEQVCSEENIRLAYQHAHRKKGKQATVREFDADLENNLRKVREALVNKTYKSSEYRFFEIREHGKTRLIASLPFFDRVIHWAVMQVLEPMFDRNILPCSHANMKGRGTHGCLRKIKEYVHGDRAEYCLKTDIRKFYPSVDKDLLVAKLERRIGDPDVMWLLKEIIYGYPLPGLPIGNYTSQTLGSFYLSDTDHWMKEVMHAKKYARYVDDSWVLGESPRWLRRVLKRLTERCAAEHLTVKGNWQIFPVSDRGVDGVGYRVWPDHILLRTRTKRRMARAMRDVQNDSHGLGVLAAYKGVLKHCDGHRLYERWIVPAERRIMMEAII